MTDPFLPSINKSQGTKPTGKTKSRKARAGDTLPKRQGMWGWFAVAVLCSLYEYLGSTMMNRAVGRRPAGLPRYAPTRLHPLVCWFPC